jgi:acyl carrier protein
MAQSNTADPTVDPVLREQAIEGICELLPVVLKQALSGLSAGSELISTLGVTSTTALEIILRLEDKLEIQISVEDLDREHLKTVGSLADYVAANLLDEE